MLFPEMIGRSFLLFDGAMGTMLYRNGVPKDVCTELSNITRPLDVLDIHIAYLDAGANVITANTFGANAVRLAQYGLSHRLEEIVVGGVALAREAVTGREAFVAASVGPADEAASDAALFDAFGEQCAYAADAGADMILIETMCSLRQARLAMLAARARTSLPVLCSFFVTSDGCTPDGNPPEVLALCAKQLGACMVGFNCAAPSELYAPFKLLSAASGIPTFILPSAGLPQTQGGALRYPITAEAFREAVKPFLPLSAAVGGCCGTTPEHIRALSTLLDAYADSPYIPEKQTFLACCAKRAVPLSAFESCPTIRISERKEAFDDMRHAPALKLDVCGMSPSKIHVQLAQMEKQLPRTPLAFIVQTAAEAEAALKRYCGVAPVYCQGDAYRVAQLAARYGAELME